MRKTKLDLRIEEAMAQIEEAELEQTESDTDDLDPMLPLQDYAAVAEAAARVAWLKEN